MIGCWFTHLDKPAWLKKLTKYLIQYKVKSDYIHSDIDTWKGYRDHGGLRNGTFDVPLE